MRFSQDSGVVCGYVSAMAHWALGYPAQAVQTMERTLAHARALAHPYSIAITLLFAAQLSQLRRDAGRTRAEAEEALAISAEHGLDAVWLWCLLPRGWAAAQRGDVAAGIADIREAMARRSAVNIGAVWPWFYALLADAYGQIGQIDDGLTAAKEALQWVHRNDERLYEAEVHRINGELLLKAGVPDEAEACFRRALLSARDLQAKSWELRAAVSMTRMLLQQSRLDEARALLAPVYDWFTEGFDTADLIEAKALLDQL
jgi:predicted ATPase